ncbi:hypothetical protein Tco_1175615 [Tanacetum coccineum]
MKSILAVNQVEVMRKHGYVYRKDIVVRRTDNDLYTFREGDFPRLRINDIEDMLLLVVQNRLTNLSGDDVSNFAIALRMFTRSLVIQKRVEDLQLGVKRRNRLMRSDEVYKFSDRTLTGLQTSLDDITKNIRMEYLPKRRMSTLEKKRANIMIKAIDNQNRRDLPRDIPLDSVEVLGYEKRSKSDMKVIHNDDGNPSRANIKQALEHAEYDESNTFVLERFNTTTGNPVKEILLKLNLPDHSDKVLKLKNFKKYASLKLSKLSYQEKYEHVGPKSQDHKMERLQDNVKRLCLVDDLKKFKIIFISSQRYKLKPKVKDQYNISQKCGLPHAHILMWLEEDCKCKTVAQIDDIISAELPSLTNDPYGYKVVTEYMLHGPCRNEGQYAPCTTEGKCTKRYPKAFYAETILDDDGYPIYRRRDNKVCVKKGKFTFDNRHVVPHNRYLLMKYHTHINVEWCNRSKAIKYLFKYLSKGHDRATVIIQENVQTGGAATPEKVVEVDEIKNYLNCRYLAPCEAVWRMLSFDIHYSYLAVMKLNFHLPEQNPITLRDSENLPALLQREGIDVTMFIDWFDLNERHPPARTLTYAKIQKHYVWHEQEKMWKPRKEKKCIGRIVYSTPASGERYYLRMLLNVVRGPRKFAELLTVNNRLCETFKAAYFAYSLLNDDKEWTRAIS